MSSYPLAPQPAPLTRNRERVVLGLVAALPALLLGIVVTVILWRVGFVAGISSFITSAGAIWLYQLGARSVPKLGLIPLFLLIVAGIVASFLGIVASDLWDVYSQFGPLPQGRISFIAHHLLDHRVLSSYPAKDYLYLVLFGVLGIVSSIRRLGRR